MWNRTRNYPWNCKTWIQSHLSHDINPIKALSFDWVHVSYYLQCIPWVENHESSSPFKHSLLTGCLIEVEQQPYLMEPCGSEHILDLTVLPQRSDRQVSDLQLDIRRMLCKGQLWHKKQTCTTQVKVNSLINNNSLAFFGEFQTCKVNV